MTGIEQFFRRVLPHLVLLRIEEFGMLQGVLSFVVVDGGAWTVRLGDPEDPVVQGAADDADLTITATAPALAELLGGTLDTAAAVRDGSVEFAGDLRVLERFGNLLTGASSSLAVRASQRRQR